MQVPSHEQTGTAHTQSYSARQPSNATVCTCCTQAFKVYNIKGKILAGPVSVVDFWGQGVKGHFSDVACEHYASHFWLLQCSRTQKSSQAFAAYIWL